MTYIKHITFLDDDQIENAEVGINDAATHRLALALTSPAGTVAGVALAEEQAHTTGGQHTLLHGETLLVVASADAHYIALQKHRAVCCFTSFLGISFHSKYAKPIKVKFSLTTQQQIQLDFWQGHI